MKKWPHMSNATDEILLAWSKAPILKKMEWLEEASKLWGLALPQKERLNLYKIRRKKQ